MLHLKKAKQAGLTLIEVLVAMVIVAIIVSISLYVVTGFASSRAAQVDTQGQAFARSYFDILKASWTTPASYVNNQLPIAKNALGIDVAYPPPPSYSYKVTVVPILSSTAIASPAPKLQDYEYSATAPAINTDACGTVAAPTPIYMKRVTIEVKKLDGATVGKVSSFSTEVTEPTRARATC